VKNTSFFFLFLLFFPNLAFAAQTSPSSVMVHGQSMEPLIKDGQLLPFVALDCGKEPSSCGSLTQGDIVLFQSASHKGMPLIKRIAGLPGDVLALRGNGIVLVNGKPAPDPSGKPYKATSQGRKMLGLYAGNPGSLDSGRYGPISQSQLMGVVKD
jgi:signal peptidase I